MPRLQKQLSRRVGKKEYEKYLVVIPTKDVKKAGFKYKQELKIKSKKGKITLEKS